MDPHSTVSTVGGLKRFTPIYEPGANLHSVLKSPFRVAETYGPPRQLPPTQPVTFKRLGNGEGTSTCTNTELQLVQRRKQQKMRPQQNSVLFFAKQSPGDKILYCMLLTWEQILGQ